MNDGKMTFEEFVNTVKENIKDYLPESFQDAQIVTTQISKLNSSYLGMQVRQEGQEMIPNINLDKFFDIFNSGNKGILGMDTVLGRMAEQIQSELGVETDWIRDYRQVKDKLFIRVNDAQENAERLQNLPKKEVDGLAVTYHIAITGSNGIEASTPVTYDLMRLYGIDENRLHADAIRSSQRINPPVFISMGEMMSRMTGLDTDGIAPAEPGHELMVLTNEHALYGAGALFYPNMMDNIASQIGEKYFIIPSSVHEVLLFVDDGTTSTRGLESIIQDVNNMVVSAEDRLSDKAYHYDSKDHILEKADTYKQRMQQAEHQEERETIEGGAGAAIEKAAGAAIEKAAEPAIEKGAEAKEQREDAPKGSQSRKETREEPAGKEAGKDTVRAARRDKGRQSSSDRAGHENLQKKERRSVLSRLSEKKEKAKTQPKKETPHRSKNAELG